MDKIFSKDELYHYNLPQLFHHRKDIICNLLVPYLIMNQTPEQLARDTIDASLLRCGWAIQDKSTINLASALGVAVREY